MCFFKLVSVVMVVLAVLVAVLLLARDSQKTLLRSASLLLGLASNTCTCVCVYVCVCDDSVAECRRKQAFER